MPTRSLLLLTLCAAACTSRPEGPAVVYSADTGRAAYSQLPDSFDFVTAAVRQLGEPPLVGARLRPGTTVIRFVWARSFHPYVAVRFVMEQKQCAVTTREMNLDETLWGPPDSTGISEATGTKAGKIIRQDSVPLLAGDCKAMRTTLERLGLWQVTSRQIGGVDGSVWRFERVDANGYSFVQRWSPNAQEGHQLWSAGLALLKMANALPSGPREIY
ncbi:MAG: hypothetical protein KA226_09165 [Gemmatimonadales bacterium]|nr:hypothetical protein [Gemmatimonadales bacterium]MBP7622302.1 hypothetical protein [Gemmatimonadales bacterium]